MQSELLDYGLIVIENICAKEELLRSNRVGFLGPLKVSVDERDWDVEVELIRLEEESHEDVRE